MTYGQYPGTGGFPSSGGRHHRPAADDGVNLTKPVETSAAQTRVVTPLNGPLYRRPVGFELDETEDVVAEEFDEVVEAKPARHPAVLASIVGVTVFLATLTIGGTLLAVNDSRERKAENYAEGPPTMTVTVTESITTTATTTVTTRPSTSPSGAYRPDEDGATTATTAQPGWYAQFGSFTSLESAQDMASRMGAQVFDGTEFGQPGQYIVAQREYSRAEAREACDLVDQSCIVKQVQ